MQESGFDTNIQDEKDLELSNILDKHETIERNLTWEVRKLEKDKVLLENENLRLDREVKSLKSEKLPKIHIYSGANDELEAFIYDSTKSFKPQLVAHGYDEDKIKETYVKEFPHNEVSWRLILPTSFDYLLK